MIIRVIANFEKKMETVQRKYHSIAFENGNKQGKRNAFNGKNSEKSRENYSNYFSIKKTKKKTNKSFDRLFLSSDEKAHYEAHYLSS